MNEQPKKKTGEKPAPEPVQCPLCGNRFEAAANEACQYCPKFFRTCGMVMCPRCSHEFPRV